MMAEPILDSGAYRPISEYELGDTADFHSGDIETQQPEPLSSRVGLTFHAVSHLGNVRPTNDDAYLIYQSSRSWERLATNLPDTDLPARFDERAYVLSVADGMGGAPAGDVASSVALRTAVNLVLNSVKWSLKLDHPEKREQEIRELIAKALDRFRRISRTIKNLASQDHDLAGMGTTLTALGIFGLDLFVFHVGDSRAYLFRQGVLERLTRDQTVVQAFVDAGSITPEQAKTHRWRHVLTGVLGGKAGQDTPEVQMLRLQHADRLLLCTDGLTEMVEDQSIVEVLSRSESPTVACQSLLERALQAGGKDNVTVVVADYSLPLDTTASP